MNRFNPSEQIDYRNDAAFVTYCDPMNTNMLLRMERQRMIQLEPVERDEHQRKLDNLVKAATLNLPQRSSYKRRQMFRRERWKLLGLIEEMNRI